MRFATTSLTRAASAAIIFAALAATASAKPATVSAETNLRKAPGTKSEVVTLVPKGETVEVGSCDAGWCKVTWNGQDGYMIGRNIGQGGPRPVAGATRRGAREYVADDEYGYDDGPGYETGPAYVVGPPYPYYYGYGYPYGYPYGYGYGRYWRGGPYHGWRGGRRW